MASEPPTRVRGAREGGAYRPSVRPVARQFGGPVASNEPYLVGERGPELFVPKTAGTIKPNSNLIGGAKVIHNQSINVSVNGRNLTEDEIIHAVVKGIRRGNRSLIAHLREVK